MIRQAILLAVGILGLGFDGIAGGCEPANATRNWPNWRGPQNDGRSSARNVPTIWGREQNIAWRLPLPGWAVSTPVVWGSRIFLTSADAEDESILLLCVHREGRELWRRTLTDNNRGARGEALNFATPSPSTDGQYVWALTADGKLACFDFEGEAVWTTDLQRRYGRLSLVFGLCSTPVLAGERLYIQVIHGDGDPKTHEAYVVALDKRTGEEVWKVARVTDARQECEHSYSSPILYRDEEHEFLLTHGGDYAIAHRLDTGAEIWRCYFNFADRYHSTLAGRASPVAADGLILVPTSKNARCLAVRPDGKGDVSESHVIWAKDRGSPDLCTPILHGGLLYVVGSGGIIRCLDATTGEKRRVVRPHRFAHRASPVLAEGRLYVAGHNGTVTVLRANTELEVIATNKLDEKLTASPVVVDGRIYLRTYEALWAIEKN